MLRILLFYEFNKTLAQMKDLIFYMALRHSMARGQKHCFLHTCMINESLDPKRKPYSSIMHTFLKKNLHYINTAVKLMIS